MNKQWGVIDTSYVDHQHRILGSAVLAMVQATYANQLHYDPAIIHESAALHYTFSTARRLGAAHLPFHMVVD
jgi:hypothetical protein